MISYRPDEVRALKWLKSRDYIPGSDAIGDGSLLGWRVVERFSLKEVFYDCSDYPNEVDPEEVEYMMKNFHPFGFTPIRIDSKGTLKDGLHRLTLARRIGLKYIDVFVEPS